MDKFYDRPPLSSRLDEEFEKIPESGFKLAEKVNSIVTEIKNTQNKKEKQKMLEKLLVHIHPLLGQAVSDFYKKFYYLLSKQGFTREDVYDKAVEEMIKHVDKWEDKETRKSKGETPANFTTYFLGNFSNYNLRTLLKREFILPALAEKRKGNEISINQPVSKHKDGGDDLQSVLPDQKTEDALASAIKNQEVEMGRDAVLNKLYSDKDPFLSLIVILRFGLGRDVLEEWRKKFDLSLKSGEIKKSNEKFILKVDQIMEKYNGEEMIPREIGESLGVIRQRVQQRLTEAFEILKNKS